MTTLKESEDVSHYISVQKVCFRYDVSKATIWRWVQTKQFPPPIKLNGCTRWRIEDLREWESNKAKAA